MPHHDHAPRRASAQRLRIARERATTLSLAALMKRRFGPSRRDADDGAGVPVDPNKPRTLDGGASVALEFDD